MNAPQTLTHKLLRRHLATPDADDGDNGALSPGEAISIAIEQTLTQDATGTLVMLELEAMELDRVATELSAQYVDHNLIQQDFKNPDDHLFLQSACQRFGVWYSRPGNGVSHPLHMQYFGKPGASLIGSDSHTPAAGGLGMLAFGAGGLDVALAMAGEPYRIKAPRVFGVELTGELPDWVSAKDVILEMLRRHGVRGGLGAIIEYHGPGLESLTTWDRHVIANMGTELGATTTVFPSDEETRLFLESNGRGGDWQELSADEGAEYDQTDRIDLASLVPLIARPSSPGDVVPVAEVAGERIGQAYIGSSANPGYRDMAVAAGIVKGQRVPDHVSFDINPASRTILLDLIRHGHLTRLIDAGARLHQAGCNGCIGMGQAPATDHNSLRTVPRNFPGRSGTPEDKVWLCSPETATASALLGRIADPRELEDELGVDYPWIEALDDPTVNRDLFLAPPPEGTSVALRKGPNIASMPELDPLPDELDLPVGLAVGDDVSTDEIMPAGARILPFRSNIPKIAEFCFEAVDPSYVERARAAQGGHAIIAGANYGQGSSREHAAVAPRHLGLRAVLARGFARIHRRNLINFGILPLLIPDPDGEATRERLGSAKRIAIRGLSDGLAPGRPVRVVPDDGATIELEHDLNAEEVATVRAGGRINQVRDRNAA